MRIVSKAAKLSDDRRHHLEEAGGAAGGVYGVQSGRALVARKNAKVFTDPKRAAATASTLASTPGHSIYSDEGEFFSHPLGAVGAQASSYKAATHANKDVKRARGAADRWSIHQSEVKNIRRGFDSGRGVPSVGRTLAHPIKSRGESDASTLSNLKAASSKKSPTLHRGMRVDRDYKVGDTVDFHGLSSWSADPDVAQQFGHSKNPLGDAMKGEPSHKAAFVRARNTGGALSIEAASPQFQQREWLAGGKHVVTAIKDGVYHVAPIVKRNTGVVMGISAFGVEDHRVSKGKHSAEELQDRADSSRRHERNSYKVAGAGLAAGVAGLGIRAAGGKVALPIARVLRRGKKAEGAVEDVKSLADSAFNTREGIKTAGGGLGIAGGTTAVGGAVAGDYHGSNRDALNRRAQNARLHKAFGLGDVASVVGSVKNAVLPKVAPAVAGARKLVRAEPLNAVATTGVTGLVVGRARGDKDSMKASNSNN